MVRAFWALPGCSESVRNLLVVCAESLRSLQAFQEQDIVPLGSWDKAANGRQKWQWRIHSPGAQSHLLIFRSVCPCSVTMKGRHNIRLTSVSSAELAENQICRRAACALIHVRSLQVGPSAAPPAPAPSYVLSIEAVAFACSEVMLPETGVVELCPSRQATAACQRYTPQDIPSSRRLVVPVIPGTTLPYICYSGLAHASLHSTCELLPYLPGASVKAHTKSATAEGTDSGELEMLLQVTQFSSAMSSRTPSRFPSCAWHPSCKACQCLWPSCSSSSSRMPVGGCWPPHQRPCQHPGPAPVPSQVSTPAAAAVHGSDGTCASTAGAGELTTYLYKIEQCALGVHATACSRRAWLCLAWYCSAHLSEAALAVHKPKYGGMRSPECSSVHMPCRGRSSTLIPCSEPQMTYRSARPAWNARITRHEAAAVVDIYAIDLRLGAMGLCTGTALPHVTTDAWHTTLDLHPSMKSEVDAPCCGIHCSSLVCPLLTPVDTSWSRLCSKGVVLPT